jgi:hypothetical protein
MHKALVIIPNEQTREYGSLLAVARAEARKREKANQNPPILALKFFPELGVYVAIYEVQDNQKREVNERSG